MTTSRLGQLAASSIWVCLSSCTPTPITIQSHTISHMMRLGFNFACLRFTPSLSGPPICPLRTAASRFALLCLPLAPSSSHHAMGPSYYPALAYPTFREASRHPAQSHASAQIPRERQTAFRFYRRPDTAAPRDGCHGKAIRSGAGVPAGAPDPVPADPRTPPMPGQGSGNCLQGVDTLAAGTSLGLGHVASTEKKWDLAFSALYLIFGGEYFVANIRGPQRWYRC